MDPNEFAVQMAKIYNDFGEDEEAAHGKMDDLMCEVLGKLGYSAGIEIYHKQKKWYA